MLFQHIHFAPPEMQSKFCNGINRHIVYEVDVLDNKGKPQRTLAGRIITREEKKENPEYWKNNSESCIFNGLLIKKDKVFVINIYIFRKENDYEPEYLDVTRVFKELLKTYNIYHVCLIIQLVTSKYYKDSTLTENLIPYIIHDRPYRLPKFRYQITKNHNRHEKFIDNSGKNRSERTWCEIIHKAIARIEICESASCNGGQRPSLFIDYTAKPIIPKVHNKSKPKPDVRGKKERKARRRTHAFTPKTGGSDSGSNIHD